MNATIVNTTTTAIGMYQFGIIMLISFKTGDVKNHTGPFNRFSGVDRGDLGRGWARK
jgi:hypothetical protein